MGAKIRAAHLERAAYVYVRQSTLHHRSATTARGSSDSMRWPIAPASSAWRVSKWWTMLLE
jgi:hypothetical protein